jgi:hypothetical protein
MSSMRGYLNNIVKNPMLKDNFENELELFTMINYINKEYRGE